MVARGAFRNNFSGGPRGKSLARGAARGADEEGCVFGIGWRAVLFGLPGVVRPLPFLGAGGVSETVTTWKSGYGLPVFGFGFFQTQNAKRQTRNASLASLERR